MSTTAEAAAKESFPYLDFKHSLVEDRNKTIESGRYIAKDQEIVIMTPAGDNKTIIEEEVSRWTAGLTERLRSKLISQKFYAHCMDCYDEWKDKGEVALSGTPIRGWSMLSPAEQENVIRANIRTVEDLAICTEDALQSIGMGARNLQTKAKTWIKVAEDSGQVVQELSQLKGSVETERESNKMLREKLEDMERALAEVTGPPKKRGRPPGS